METDVDYSITQQFINEQGAKNSYIFMYIQLDESYKQITRKVVAFTEAVG